MVNSALENEVFEEKMLRPRLGRRLLQVLHGFGLSCLAGAVVLQVLVFFDIDQRGYFFAVEQNPVVLWAEIVLSGFTVAYFVSMYVRFIHSLRR
jgi:hypothetical protein